MMLNHSYLKSLRSCVAFFAPFVFTVSTDIGHKVMFQLEVPIEVSIMMMYT
jgi:hypothetical protein